MSLSTLTPSQPDRTSVPAGRVPPPSAEPPERTEPVAAWPLWQRIGFRLVAVYVTLFAAPWTWVQHAPGGWRVSGWWGRGLDWFVLRMNAGFLHVRPELVPTNNSGDTSWAWAQFWSVLIVSVLATLVWSVLDRRRRSYARSAYWLRLLMRVQLMAAMWHYGFMKVFPLQMPPPELSEYATPIGDLSPQRLAWVYFGYSVPYQIFAGVVEVTAGLLLFWRRTATLGVLLSCAILANVAMIDLSYDIPVKLYALELLALALLLLAMDGRRLARVLVQNLPVGPNTLYDPPTFGLPMRLVRLFAKAGVIYAFMLGPFFEGVNEWKEWTRPEWRGPIAPGVYHVRTFIRNGVVVPETASDTLRWRDVIFENTVGGSVGTADTLFWQRYGRGYFRTDYDTRRRSVQFSRTSMRRNFEPLFEVRYAVPDARTVQLWTRLRGDSLFMELVRTDRRFPLAERPFHWVTESVP